MKMMVERTGQMKAMIVEEMVIVVNRRDGGKDRKGGKKGREGGREREGGRGVSTRKY